ncbi:MAG: hypothetical protein IJ928_11985 [Prevotella sp.]|nr:hypothetical protein [Prevotella sp.]
MNFLKLIIRAPRPNRVIDMPASVNRFFCRKGYAAITLFGHIFTGEQHDADRMNKGYTFTKNHEMIHLKQAQNTRNSWFLFYILYLWHSLLALRYFRKTKNAAYYLNPFEMEAYMHTRDLHYIENCGDKGACQWRTFARMSLAERLQLVKEHHIVR